MVAPTISINGTPIASSVARSTKRVGMANVRVEWGRETVFDKPRPGVAEVRVMNLGIDAPPPRKGDSIVIEYPGYGPVFRGLIAEADTDTDYITHANGLREKVTETVIVAHDALAAVNQFIPVGPATTSTVPGAGGGEGGWNTEWSTTRIASIMNAGVNQFVDNAARPTSIVQDTPPIVRAMAAPLKPSETSALDLLHAAYAMYRPLTSFTYEARVHSLWSALVGPAEDAQVTLQAAGTSLSIATTAHKLLAGHIEIDTTKLGAPADDVAVVRLEYTRLDTIVENGAVVGYEYVDAAASKPVPNSQSGRTYTAPQRPQYVTIMPWHTELEREQNRYIQWWLDTAATTFTALNGTATLPPLTIDPEDPALADSRIAFATTEINRSFYLAGSMFNGEPGAPSVVRVLGGVLQYSPDGWRHTLTTAPTAGGAPAPLTLDQMFPSTSTDRLDDWDDTLTINDLAAVNRRA